MISQIVALYKDESWLSQDSNFKPISSISRPQDTSHLFLDSDSYESYQPYQAVDSTESSCRVLTR